MDYMAGLDASFPRSGEYRRLLRDGNRAVHEERAAGLVFPFTERHLQCVWADDRLRPRHLRATSGEAVTVEWPGRWNLEAGPDFLDATLLVEPGARRMQGDVEVHIRPADWTAHGHEHDPLYRRVIAHVCYFQGTPPAGTLPPGALHLSLRDPLHANPAFSFEAIDVAAYPYAAIADVITPCREALRRCSALRRASVLDAAGHERMRLKAIRLQATLASLDGQQVFYEEIMAALGYKQNQTPFRGVARRLPADMLSELADGDSVAAYALLLGVAGLLPRRDLGRDPETRRFLRRLWDAWWRCETGLGEHSVPVGAWRLSGLRPQNHPRRRLAAAAALFSRNGACLDALHALDTRRAKSWFADAESILRTRAEMPYWSRRLTLSGRLHKKPVTLLGRRRVAAILSNVVIPLLAAEGEDVAALLEHLPAETDNTIIRQTAQALFGHDHNPALYRHGLRQQGLIQIFHDFCVTSRAECGNCRLAAALASQNEDHDEEQRT